MGLNLTPGPRARRARARPCLERRDLVQQLVGGGGLGPDNLLAPKFFGAAGAPASLDRGSLRGGGGGGATRPDLTIFSHAKGRVAKALFLVPRELCERIGIMRVKEMAS